jgi:hypothetical protein
MVRTRSAHYIVALAPDPAATSRAPVPVGPVGATSAVNRSSRIARADAGRAFAAK